jgi:hypothetical protein
MRLFTGFLCVLLVSGVAIGQDRTPSAEKVKEQALDSLKKIESKNPRIVETAHLVIATGLPESKVKGAGEVAEKMFLKAHKALRFDTASDREPKSIVFLFQDVEEFRRFKRTVLKERAEDDEYSMTGIRNDIPFIAISPRRSDKNPNFEAIIGDEICKGLLVKKAGNSRLNEWMKDGFAQAVAGRLDTKAISSERATARRLAPPIRKGAKASPVVDKAWMGSGRDKDAVAVTLMDFFVFGGGVEKFSALLAGLSPTDVQANPPFAVALEATGWKLEELDAAWRDWLAKGCPEYKEPAKK